MNTDAIVLVVAAAHATPAGDGWLAQVTQTALDLYRAAQVVDAEIELFASCTPITGVILRVTEMSGRGLITIRPTMGNSADDPEATEELRTPWLNEPRGAFLFAEAQALVGQNCRFGKWYDPILDGPRKGQKIRMCAWVERLSAPARPTQQPTPPPNVNGETGEVSPPKPAGVIPDATDIAALRNLFPKTPEDLARMVAQYLSHVDHEDIRAVMESSLGGTGRAITSVALARTWNDILTRFGAAS